MDFLLIGPEATELGKIDGRNESQIEPRVKKRMSGLGPMSMLYKSSSDSFDDDQQSIGTLISSFPCDASQKLRDDTLEELMVLIMQFPECPTFAPDSSSDAPFTSSSAVVQQSVQSLTESFSKTLGSFKGFFG